jgi:epsin
MQLQIALALSREECEKEEEMRKGDAIRLQMALEESKKNGVNQEEIVAKTVTGASLTQSALDDLLSLNLGEPVAPIAGPSGLGTSAATASHDPWAPMNSTSIQQGNDPWSPVKKPEIDPCKSYPLLTPFLFSSGIFARICSDYSK